MDRTYSLSDLYRRGKEFKRVDKFPHPEKEGETIEIEVDVWINKLNPVDAKSATKKASASRVWR